MTTFYLGTHQPGWLTRAGVPLCVTAPRLAPYKTLPVATEEWLYDSGGFTEMQKYGAWRTSPQQHADTARRYFDGIGNMAHAAIQDEMCEPMVISGGVMASGAGTQYFVGTGRTVLEHQERTVASYLRLRELDPDLPWLPTLQGFNEAEYHHCADLYESAGVDLAAAPLVGLGSVCRREATREARDIVFSLADRGYRLHGFGMKTTGLAIYGHRLASADSLAWSAVARRERILLQECEADPECRHQNCANCLRFAMRWRGRVLDSLSGIRPARKPRKPLIPGQVLMFGDALEVAS